MEAIIIIVSLMFLSWVYYQIQKNIGEEQARDWDEYKKEHPELFPKPLPVEKKSHITGSKEELKYVKEMWARHDAASTRPSP